MSGSNIQTESLTDLERGHVWRRRWGRLRTSNGFADLSYRVEQLLVRIAPFVDLALVANISSDGLGILNHWRDIWEKEGRIDD